MENYNLYCFYISYPGSFLSYRSNNAPAKKLGEIKNDFINNMTHEFKTPIATISLAVDAMRNEKVISDRTKLGYFSGIIKEENQRMNRQVETILKASQLEKQEVDLNLKPVHVHEVINDVVDNFILQLEDKKEKLNYC